MSDEVSNDNYGETDRPYFQLHDAAFILRLITYEDRMQGHPRRWVLQILIPGEQTLDLFYTQQMQRPSEWLHCLQPEYGYFVVGMTGTGVWRALMTQHVITELYLEWCSKGYTKLAGCLGQHPLKIRPDGIGGDTIIKSCATIAWQLSPQPSHATVYVINTPGQNARIPRR